MRRAVCGRASSGAFRRNGLGRREPRAYESGTPPGPWSRSANLKPDNNAHATQKSPRAPGGPSRLAAALVALAMLAFAAPASAGTDLLNATVVVKNHTAGDDFVGYGGDYPSSTTSVTSFTDGRSYSFDRLTWAKNDSSVYLELAPFPTASQTSAWTLHIGTRSIAFSGMSRATQNEFLWADSNAWSSADTPFTDGASLSVRISTNAAPTLANPIPDQSAVVGTAFSYAFPDTTFSDADTGDTLAYAATKADDAAAAHVAVLRRRHAHLLGHAGVHGHGDGFGEGDRERRRRRVDQRRI